MKKLGLKLAGRSLGKNDILGYLKDFLILFLIVVISQNANGQGSESFSNLPASSSAYSFRTWTGTDGVTWTADGARTDQTLNGKAICFGTSSTRAVYSPTYSGGMGTLSFNYVRGFTGTSARTIQVFVNGSQIGSDISVNPNSSTPVLYTNTINVSGNVVLEIRSTGAAQVVVDDIAWTSYIPCTPPSAPTGSSPQTFCASANPTIASLSASGSNIQWYAASSGGTALATTTALVNGTTYYASQSSGGCESTSRLAVTANLTTVATPTGSSPQLFCGGGTISGLAASGTGTLQWFSAASGGSPLSGGTNLGNGTTYYSGLQDGSGCRSTTRLPVVVYTAAPGTPGTITQPGTTPCQGSTGNSYSIGAVSNATSYTWSVSGTGWLVTAGGTTISATITAGTGSNIVSVTADNGCGSSAPRSTPIVNPPTVATLGAITGNSTVCPGNNEAYSVSAVAGVSSYNWTLPAGWSFVSGAGTNSVVVTPNTSGGNINVTATNSCGTGPAQTLSITNGGSVSTPTSLAASSVGANSFTANWNTVAGATSYYLDVYTGNVEDFTDGNFTTSPVWSGNTSNFSILTASTLPNGLAATDGSYLGTNASTSYSILTTPSTEVSRWSFSLGSTDFQPSSGNYFGVILMSSAAISGDISAATFNGYYLKIGVNGSTDPIELWRSSGTVQTQVGDFPSSPNYDANALQSGLNIIVTRNGSGQFELFYSTGFTYPANPTISAGVLTDNSYSTSSYFGVYGRFASTSATRRVYIDNILLGNVSYVAGYNNFSTSGTNAIVSGLNPGTVYNYVVRASNGICSSAFSNIISATTSVCTPVHSIISFAPTTGPVGTYVTITGTNFTGATAVNFSGVPSSSFSVVNSTTIIARVPANIPTTAVQISITASGCEAIAASNFTLLNQSGSCGGTMTNLIISEIFDPETGNNHYIELFNGTANAINLSAGNYRVEVQNNPSGTLTSISLTGTINAGSVLVLYAGNNGGLATAPAQGVGVGFNEADQIRLYQNGSIIDRVIAPNNEGYNYRRLNTVTGPASTYNGGQWTIIDDGTETSSDIGIFTTSPVFIVTAHPSDIAGCASLSFTASVSAAGTFNWYFNNASTGAGWATVTQGNLQGADPENANISVTITQTPSSGTTTSSTITITSSTGDLTYLQNYQFYARIVSGSCTKYSNAAQYTYTTLPVYRSKTGVVAGNWEDPAIWEMASLVSDPEPWASACQYPIAKNSGEVIIRDGTSVVLNANISIDKVTISNTGNTGKLTINSTALLTFLNSQTGPELILNGILEDNGSNANGIDLKTNSSTWQMGADATLIKTGLSAASDYREQYESGIINIPATANWIYRHITSNIEIASSASGFPMYYPNLTLENSVAGTYTSPFNSTTPNLSKFTFLGSTEPIVIKGDFNVGGSGIGNINFKSTNTFDNLIIEGNLNIKSGSTLTTYGDASNVGNGFDLKGNLINYGNLTTSYNGSNPSSGMLKLTGSAPQSVSGSGTFSLYDLTVENVTGGSVELLTNILVPNQLTLNNGVVTTHDAVTGGLLTLGSATNSVNGSLPGPGPFAYINGPMAKQFAIGASVRFNFPIGKSSAPPSHGVYNPAGIKPMTIAGATTTFTAEYFYSPYAASSVMGPNVLAISSKEYWEISKAGGNAGNTARVILNYRNPGNNNWGRYEPNFNVSAAYAPCNTCNVAVVHRDAVTTTWDFTSTGGNFSAADPEYRFYPDEGEIFSAPTSNFSPFTLAYAYNAILVLPVKLTSFSGTLLTADGKLAWSVADTKDLLGFELEYSVDGFTYRKLADVGPNGNSTNFSFLHKDLPPGTNFYRLLVKDKSGNQFYSQVVLLRVGKLKTYLIGLSPTVVTDQVMPVIFSAGRQEAEAMITDVLGRRISIMHQHLEPGANQWRIQTAALARGTYYLSIMTKDGMRETRRFIKE